MTRCFLLSATGRRNEVLLPATRNIHAETVNAIEPAKRLLVIRIIRLERKIPGTIQAVCKVAEMLQMFWTETLTRLTTELNSPKVHFFENLQYLRRIPTVPLCSEFVPDRTRISQCYRKMRQQRPYYKYAVSRNVRYRTRQHDLESRSPPHKAAGNEPARTHKYYQGSLLQMPA